MSHDADAGLRPLPPAGPHPEPVIGIVSTGEMGGALGAALLRGGARVLTTVAGRSPRTAGLAEHAGLELVGSLDDVVRRATVLLSVVPPQSATSVGADLAGRARHLGVRPLLVDLNAVTPADVGQVESLATAAGLRFVDGAVSGPPPGTGSAATRVFLAGAAAPEVAALPWGAVEVTVVSQCAGDASAVKMCTGGVRKGLSALLINALLTAAEHGVLGPVQAELRRMVSLDPIADVELTASKAWRYAPEMDAVAGTQAAAGLDPTLYREIAGLFRRVAASPLADRRPEEVRLRADESGERAAHAAAVIAALRPADRTA